MRYIRAAAVAALGGVMLAPAGAAAADFYKDRTVEVYIGSSAGGGYNAYARLTGKYLVQHLPGRPAVVFKNMPGAGGRKLTAWLANVAPKNGLVLAGSQPGSLVEPVLGNPKNAKYDPRTFAYIGSANSSVYVCAARTDAKVKSFKDAFASELVLGASGRGASTLDTALLLKNVLGVKFRVINGYKGSTEIMLALQQGEVHGICGYAWASLMSRSGHLVRDKKVNLLVQYAMDGNPEATKAGVPMVWDFVKTDEQRAVLELALASLTFGRPYFMPAGVPAARLADMRKAFDAAMKDKRLLADAKRQKLIINPASGERVEKLIARVFAAPKAVQDKAKKALYTE